jgi:hypothetical protein
MAGVAVICVAAACGESGGSPTGPSYSATGGRLTMTFAAENASFTAAAETYHRLFSDEGAAIVDALERASGLTFTQREITAIVYEGISSSGTDRTPMRLRASYNADTKRSALAHELGHRLIAQLSQRPSDLVEHRVLFLVLYDMWVRLWGVEFAERQVQVESNLRGVYDYESAWRWALSLTSEQRAARFAEIKRANGR